MISLRRAVLAVSLFAVCAIGSSALAVSDFTFIHATDVHAPSSASETVFNEMRKMEPVELTPYNLTVAAPSFTVVSGDVSEFGGGDGAWAAYLGYFKDFPMPVYHQLGNHDGPWFVCRPYLQKIYGSSAWSFDKGGCHFIGLDNSTPHDPRANITEEQFVFIKSDLKKIKPETPVFLVIHHPLNDTYFGSPYAVARFVDQLRPYNLIGVLMGHGHSANVQKYFGIDNIQGGATCGPISKKITPGYSVLAIKDNTLYVAHKFTGEATATKPIITKPIPARSTYPRIEILSPSENGIRREGKQIIKVKISGNENPIVKAGWVVDKGSFDKGPYTFDIEKANPLTLRDGAYEAEAHYEEWVAGAHYIQVAFQDSRGEVFTKCVRFGTEPAPSRLIWRVFVEGSCRGAATVSGDTVYVGATDMKLYALDKATGKVKWTFKTGADVATKPLVVGDTIYFGSGDGKLYALTLAGKLKWSFAAKEGIYSSPVYSDGIVMFGSDDSDFYGVDAKTGKQAWVFTEPGYSIEVQPFVDGGMVVFGAWDQYIYALDVKTGALKWKCMGHGSEVQPAAKRYYSPADAGPVVCAGKVFVADRNSDLTIVDAATGTKIKGVDDSIAVGISQDGKAVYERKPGIGLWKLDSEGNQIWKASADVDSVPAAPVERDGIVYVVHRLGLVQAFKASDGSPLWQYQATPQLYVLSEVEAKDGIAYVTGMDGSVTALKAK